MRSLPDQAVPWPADWADPQPLPEWARRLLIWEIIAVFSVSLGASAPPS